MTCGMRSEKIPESAPCCLTMLFRGGKGLMNARVRVIGAGLAGSEAAWQSAQRGVEVELFEMRPVRSTPAHQTADFTELGVLEFLEVGF